MNDVSYTQLKEKISRRATILAIVFIVGMTSSFSCLLYDGVAFTAFLFPPATLSGLLTGYGKGLGLIFLACVILLLVWGKKFHQEPYYANRLFTWYAAFIVLLICYFILAILLLIQMPLILGYTAVPYEFSTRPLAESIWDVFVTRDDYLTMQSWSVLLILIPLIIYFVEGLYMLSILRKARNYADTEVTDQNKPQ